LNRGIEVSRETKHLDNSSHFMHWSQSFSPTIFVLYILQRESPGASFRMSTEVEPNSKTFKCFFVPKQKISVWVREVLGSCRFEYGDMHKSFKMQHKTITSSSPYLSLLNYSSQQRPQPHSHPPPKSTSNLLKSLIMSLPTTLESDPHLVLSATASGLQPSPTRPDHNPSNRLSRSTTALKTSGQLHFKASFMFVPQVSLNQTPETWKR